MVYVNRIVTINVNLMGYWLILTVSMCSSELYKPQRRDNANGGIVSCKNNSVIETSTTSTT